MRFAWFKTRYGNILCFVNALSTGSAASAWDVFLLFSIPIGGGIPAGVLLAQNRGIGWLEMSVLYLASDVVLAFMFEPLMVFIAFVSRRYHVFAKVVEAFRKSTNQTIARFGTTPGPFLLVVIAFGIDPMTGRAAALAAGHSFLSGWTIAIAGDMLFYGVVAISTICLNNILGDGTWTAIVIMAAMIGIPALVRRVRESRRQ